jgi:hypothetical protein
LWQEKFATVFILQQESDCWFFCGRKNSPLFLFYSRKLTAGSFVAGKIRHCFILQLEIWLITVSGATCWTI